MNFLLRAVLKARNSHNPQSRRFRDGRGCWKNLRCGRRRCGLPSLFAPLAASVGHSRPPLASIRLLPPHASIILEHGTGNLNLTTWWWYRRIFDLCCIRVTVDCDRACFFHLSAQSYHVWLKLVVLKRSTGHRHVQIRQAL